MSLLHKHIVIVSSEFPPQPGGIGNHAHNLAVYLAKEHNQVTVIADQRSTSGKEEQDFDQLQTFKIKRIKRYSMRFIMYIKRVIVTYKSLKNADYIIATGKFSLWNVALLSYVRQFKKLGIIHGTEVNFKSFFLRKSIEMALKRINHIVAVSNYTKDLVAHLDINVTVIPNGIDLSQWETPELASTPLKGAPILTTVGRVSSRKGQLNVIKQLPELVKYFPDIHYHCVGIPSEANAFLDIATKLEVDGYVTFHGSLEFLNLKQILRETDIFVMLSSESSSGDVEGFGIAILEANAMGVPAIGAKGCGIEDAIHDHDSGILIPLDDSESFIKAIQTIQEAKTDFQTGALNWSKKHDWVNIVKSYMKLLR